MSMILDEKELVKQVNDQKALTRLVPELMEYKLIGSLTVKHVLISIPLILAVNTILSNMRNRK